MLYGSLGSVDQVGFFISKLNKWILMCLYDVGIVNLGWNDWLIDY